MRTLHKTTWIAFVIAVICAAPAASQQPAQNPPPLVKENATVKVSDHVHVIPDGNVPVVPNVGIIVGSRATLVVDTGLGPRNGQTVLREMAKVSRNAEVYVVSTHFHPEHALGEPAFTNAKVIRARAQQKDIEEFGLTTAQAFAGRSPVMAELLKDVQFRRADELFDTEKVLDLGGVRARIFWIGPTHTAGDTLVYVEGDNVLFAGDVVMNQRFVSFGSPHSSVKAWVNSLDRLAGLTVNRIVPSHGNMGEKSLIDANRSYLTALQGRVAELKKQGKSVDEVVQTVSAEIPGKFPGWTNPNAIGAAARIAYAEAN